MHLATQPSNFKQFQRVIRLVHHFSGEPARLGKTRKRTRYISRKKGWAVQKLNHTQKSMGNPKMSSSNQHHEQKSSYQPLNCNKPLNLFSESAAPRQCLMRPRSKILIKTTCITLKPVHCGSKHIKKSAANHTEVKKNC